MKALFILVSLILAVVAVLATVFVIIIDGIANR